MVSVRCSASSSIQPTISTSPVSCCWTTAATSPAGSRRSRAATAGSRPGWKEVRREARSPFSPAPAPLSRARGPLGDRRPVEPPPARPHQHQAEGDQRDRGEQDGVVTQAAQRAGVPGHLAAHTMSRTNQYPASATCRASAATSTRQVTGAVAHGADRGHQQQHVGGQLHPGEHQPLDDQAGQLRGHLRVGDAGDRPGQQRGEEEVQRGEQHRAELHEGEDGGPGDRPRPAGDGGLRLPPHRRVPVARGGP